MDVDENRCSSALEYLYFPEHCPPSNHDLITVEARGCFNDP